MPLRAVVVLPPVGIVVKPELVEHVVSVLRHSVTVTVSVWLSLVVDGGGGGVYDGSSLVEVPGGDVVGSLVVDNPGGVIVGP